MSCEWPRNILNLRIIEKIYLEYCFACHTGNFFRGLQLELLVHSNFFPNVQMKNSDPESLPGSEGTIKPNPLDETMQLQAGDTTPASGSAAREHPERWVGQRLGKYEITGILGAGGMGVVLKGHDPTIERDVAIKVLPGQLSADETKLQRFLAEAKSAGKLNHPNTVTIYEVGHDGGVHYLVMEIVGGGSAADQIERGGPCTVSDSTRLVIEAARGLAAAHQQGLIHRDVKPANLLLTIEGSAKVADFGLAKQSENQSMMLTQEGFLVGSPYYMSPEQCQGKPVDSRSDIYSLGATYYSLLTGKCPFHDSGSVIQVIFAHCNAGPPDPREVQASVPAACSAIIQRAMAKDPDHRYQSMDQMRIDLEAVLAALSGAGIHLPSQVMTGTKAVSVAGSKSNRRRFLGAAIAGTGLAGGLASLGGYFVFTGSGGPGGRSSPIDSRGAAAVPPEGEPIRVGILHSLTGTMSASGSSVTEATLLAIEELNRGGGLLGRPVEPVVADGRSDPAKFLVEARRLIEEEKVCTVFGCWTSASRKTVVPLFEELDHLLVYPLQYEGIEESPNVIYTGATPNQQVIPAVKWAYNVLEKKRFFLVGSDYVFPRVVHEIIKDQLQDLGAELAGEAFLRLGDSDVRPIIDQIESANPDMILNSINGNSNIAFFRELRAAGYISDKLPTLSFSVAEEELRQLDISEVSGDYAAWNYFQSITSEENTRFVASYHQKYGPQRVVSDPMESAYVGVKLWAQAVAEVGGTDIRQVRHAMLSQRMTAPSGNVRIDSATQHTFKTPRIGRITADGQFEVVWTASNPEPPMPYTHSRTAANWRAFLHDLYLGWGNRWSAP
jgi:urea transport system substrate-binding protein